ncbi:MAG: glutamate racemase [Candidatus Krumholzibacteria bacterium]|jgi:glutamate racemase|nr:glutamate racemase [Candidatus Krumholzibacteria bacterium]MDP6669105.1 glutamate racemase [Candidatus Krumholzibacteria bacterium]MDP6797484.1 glutamate racemase [Candidatus Krumholzibacteria bacterium]MDP7021974.1 glutamate racemase [Candidatus Krumholzibacteria bacterium]
MKQEPIGIWDSGLGGLTVVREIRRRLPGEKLIYFGDTARVPYGIKGRDTVRRFARENTAFLVEQGVKALVVACNTASSLALDLLREEFSLPILGVIEPGARAAAEGTKNGIVGVIGTPATVDSAAYTAALKALRGGLSVSSRACPLFVPLVEEGWLDHPATRLVAREYLSPLMEAGVDTLVLGCTHYPLLQPLLQELMGEGVRLVDSAEELAGELSELLGSGELETSDSEQGSLEVFVSDLPLRFRQIGESFLGESIENLTLLDRKEER